MIEHKFALGIKKSSEDGITWKVTVGSKGEGITMEEAWFYIEGWTEKVRSELKKKHFSQLKFGNE